MDDNFINVQENCKQLNNNEVEIMNNNDTSHDEEEMDECNMKISHKETTSTVEIENKKDLDTESLSSNLDNLCLNGNEVLSDNTCSSDNDKSPDSPPVNHVMTVQDNFNHNVDLKNGDLSEEDNLHGLSIQTEPSSTTDEKAHFDDSERDLVQGQNVTPVVSHNENTVNMRHSDDSTQKEYPHLAVGSNLSNHAIPENTEETLHENEDLPKAEYKVINSSSHCTSTQKFNVNSEVSEKMNSLIQENLAEISPKKEALVKNTPNLPSPKQATPIPERSKRVNPFNSVDCSEDASDLWQMRRPPSHQATSETRIHDVQPAKNAMVSPVESPQHATYGYNFNHSQKTHNTQPSKWEEMPSPSSSRYPLGPQFELMPSNHRRLPHSSDLDSCPGVDDIEAVVREVKLKNSFVPTTPKPDLNDPWVKIEAEDSVPVEEFEETPNLSNHYQSQPEPNLPVKEVKETTMPQQPNSLIRPLIEAAGPCEPVDLIEGIIFTANYLGSTQLQSERNPGKNARMLQAQEAVSRIKAPDGESQPSVEVDLFISTDKVKILNADTQETMMDHTLRSISYIADIGKLLVIMARRRAPHSENPEEPQIMRDPKPQRSYRVICHVFSSHDSHLMAQAIGQAFNVAYQQFLTANGIEPQTLTRDDYNELLDMQEMYHDDLVHYSKRENVKDLWVEKKKGESLGVVVVESGWGSIVPTVILANLQHGGPAERCGKLSIGDQIMSVNGTSLVGLPISTCQSIVKGLRAQTIARLNIVSCPPVVTVLIKRPDLKYQLGFSVQDGIICSLMRGGIAERGGVRVGHRIIEINGQSVVATLHEKIVQTLVSSVGEIQMKTMPATMYRLLTGQEQPVYI